MMIAKRIPLPKKETKNPKKRDNFKRLGEYVGVVKTGDPSSLGAYIAATEQGEKLDNFWIVNCNAGENLENLKDALIEIEAVRSMKPGIPDKSYHLVLSFRDGEREKLSESDLKDIEKNFAEALGYQNHQRIVGTHVNTDNFHMHIAYNMIHPETYKKHEPGFDYRALERTARKMEKKYGLFVDRGMSDANRELSQQARKFEAMTWQQSFESHMKEHKAEILDAISKAASWGDVHKELAGFDAGLKKHANGLVFYPLSNSGSLKASALDRSCSLKALQDRFGPFQLGPQREQPPQNGKSAKADRQNVPPPEKAPRRPYTARPLLSHPGQDPLWRIYQKSSRPGLIRRNFLNVSSWRDYLLSEAYKDALAMAIIVSYKELLHSAEGAIKSTLKPGRSRQSTRAPKAIMPGLRASFEKFPWQSPKPGFDHPEFEPGVGLKIDSDNRVLFPLRDSDGMTWAIRAVDPAGRVCDIGKIEPGLRHVLDSKKHLQEFWQGPILVTADCQVATTLHKIAGTPVILAGREADLPILAREYPSGMIVSANPEISKVGHEEPVLSLQEAISEVRAWDQAGKKKRREKESTMDIAR